MSKKIITINPELFKRKKTKKKAIISDKVINKTLINRIKEKKKEKKYEPKPTNNKFDESDNFLTNILQKHPKNETLRVRAPLNNYTQTPITKTIENILFKPKDMETINLNYKVDMETPYGNMKKGLKPTLKNWKLGKKIKHPDQIKNVTYSEAEEAKRIMESEINKAINGKTEFSTDLLEKFQGDEKIVISDEDIKIEPELISDLNTNMIGSSRNIPPIDINVGITSDLNLAMKQSNQIVLEPEITPIVLEPINHEPNVNLEFNTKNIGHVNSDISDLNKLEIKPIHTEEPTEIVNVKVNQTIKRKYHLGKKNGKLGLFIPNKKTQKEKSEMIKKINSTENDVMKKTLKEQGLIQVGSSAPSEVIRNIYNNSQLAGIVINENKDILLSNLLDDN